jgi:uncharacterized protein
VKGGHIVDRETLRREITPHLGPVEIQIDDNLFITPVNAAERELSMLYSNHSCDPNLGLRGEITFVAMREIRAGEELTHDWAMTDDDDYSAGCNCGASSCRKTLTGKDWQKAGIAKEIRRLFLGLSRTQDLEAVLTGSVRPRYQGGNTSATYEQILFSCRPGRSHRLV